MILCGDNVTLLRDIATPVQLVYMDPPWFKQRNFKMRDGTVAYSDKWPSFEAYQTHVVTVAELCWALLDPGCSLVLHVDQDASHYLKVALDAALGRENFASEIIWRYRRWPTKTPNFQRMHDVPLRYVRGLESKPRFNQLYEPLAASTLKTFGTGKQVAQVSSEGRRTHSVATAQPSPGVPMGDVWDIGIIAPMAKERTGYPTQKPKVLLSRIITALTHEGDTVLDPYCGSGTSCSVAFDTKRKFIGIDKNPVAVEIAKLRTA